MDLKDSEMSSMQSCADESTHILGIVEIFLIIEWNKDYVVYISMS
jgi:hypothetical protein